MTRGISHTHLKVEAIRLRVEERKSLKEIESQIGVSRGSLSPWLKEYPLTNLELGKRKHSRRGPLARTESLRGQPAPSWSFAKKLTRHQKAHLAEAAIQFRLILHGFRVFRSVVDGDRIDFLVLEDHRVIRLQVKCVKSNANSLPGIELRRTRGHDDRIRYTREEVDFFVGYWAYNDTAYVYAFSELNQQTNKTVSVDGMEKWNKLQSSGR